MRTNQARNTWDCCTSSAGALAHAGAPRASSRAHEQQVFQSARHCRGSHCQASSAAASAGRLEARTCRGRTANAAWAAGWPGPRCGTPARCLPEGCPGSRVRAARPGCPGPGRPVPGRFRQHFGQRREALVEGLEGLVQRRSSSENSRVEPCAPGRRGRSRARPGRPAARPGPPGTGRSWNRPGAATCAARPGQSPRPGSCRPRRSATQAPIRRSNRRPARRRSARRACP